MYIIYYTKIYHTAAGRCYYIIIYNILVTRNCFGGIVDTQSTLYKVRDTHTHTRTRVSYEQMLMFQLVNNKCNDIIMHINNAHIIIVVHVICTTAQRSVAYRQSCIIYLRVCASVVRWVAQVYIYLYYTIINIYIYMYKRVTHIAHTCKIIHAFPFTVRFLFYSRPHAPLDFLFIAGINERHHCCNTAPLQLSSAITGRYSPRRRPKRTSFIYFIYICVKSVRAGTEITHRNA